MRSTTVRRQLTVLLLTTSAVALVCLGATFLLLRSVRAAHDRLETSLIPAQQLAFATSRSVTGVEVRVRADLDPLDPPAIERGRLTVEQLLADIRTRAGDDPAIAAAIDEVRLGTTDWFDALAASGGAPSADATRRHDELVGRIAELADTIVSEIDRTQEQATTASRWILASIVLTAGAIAVATTVTLVVLRRSVLRPLDRLVRGINTVADGDLAEPIAASGPLDLASVGHAAERMRRRLLADAERRTESALIAGQLAESSRIAGQLHDDQVQAMTLVSIRLQQVARKVEDDPDVAETVAMARSATTAAVERLRRMMFELHSPVLETEGLEAAIESYVEETFDDDVRVRIDAALPDLPPPTAALAYRLAREALLNVVKHARASSVTVTLSATGPHLRVEIVDDGVGFDPATAEEHAGHLGLAHAADLAAAAGGAWTVESAVGAGTTVTLTLPIRDDPGTG